MMQEKQIDDILITRYDNQLTISNLINGAFFSLQKNEIKYFDPFGNCMTNVPIYIDKNNKIIELKEGDSINTANSNTIMVLAETEVLEIVNKTFYAENQPHIFDFVKFTLNEDIL